MTKNLFITLCTFFILICFSNQSFAADFVDEFVSDPMSSSLIENTKAEKKLIRLKKANAKKTKIKSKNNVETNKSNEKTSKTSDSSDSDVILDSDHMDYYPERMEIEAIGNAKLTLKQQGLKITANKIVFNHDLNLIKAYEDVTIVNENSVTEGDFLNLNLNKENGLMTNPITKNYSIQISSKEGYIYSDRIEEYDGVAKILKNYDLKFGNNSFANLVDPGRISNDFEGKIEKRLREESKEKGVYKIKAKTIYIDSRDEHNIMTMKSADIYMRKFKLGTASTLKVVSDKSQQAVDTNLPEIGSMSNMGMYIGPGIVLNAPNASTLKIAPLLNYSGDIGVGGIVRFRNANNLTEMGYGSAENKFILRGEQRFTPSLRLTYSQNAYQDEWFMGYRMPRYGASLQYDKAYQVDDLNLTFTHRLSAGYMSDNDGQITNAKGRFRWMTQTQKPIYSYLNDKEDFELKVALVAQTAISMYTTGDTFGLARLGPMLKTTYKRWSQNLYYFQAATAGESPFEFDRYAYGKGNIVFIESLKLNKYLTVGYLGSLAFMRDCSDDNVFQENRFLVSVGPEHAKVTLGYDAFRQNTMLLLSMAVGTEGSDIAFKKAVLKNPDNLGKAPEEKESKVQKLMYKVFPAMKESETNKSSVN